MGGGGEGEGAVGGAMGVGVNYFDTAPLYGDGQSEQNLGAALKALRAPVHVGTKFRLGPADLKDVRGAIARSLDASLARLGLRHVDLLQLHNNIFQERGPQPVSVADVVGEVVPALQALQTQGKTRFWGITALGETAALQRVLDGARLYTAQVCYNLLNPSAGVEVPRGFPAQDFGRLLDRARQKHVGVIVIRMLAAGALSGVSARHPVPAPTVDPVAPGPASPSSVRRSHALRALLQEGHAGSLVEASLRFALAPDPVSTLLLGSSSLEHLAS